MFLPPPQTQLHSHEYCLYPPGSLPLPPPRAYQGSPVQVPSSPRPASFPSWPPWLIHSTVLTLTSDPWEPFPAPFMPSAFLACQGPRERTPASAPTPRGLSLQKSGCNCSLPSSLMSYWLLGAGHMGPDLLLSEAGYCPTTPTSP